MATLDAHAVYDELLDLLADGADVQRVLAFRLSSCQQERLDILLEKNREGTLTAEETVRSLLSTGKPTWTNVTNSRGQRIQPPFC